MKATLFENHSLFPHCAKDGIAIPLNCPVSRYAEIETDQFKSRDTDVLIATFPKSGTTWLQTMVYTLLGCPNGPITAITQQVPWLQCCAQHLEKLEALSSPRLFKTHAYWSWLPKKIQDKAKFIYCVRNAKDQCVSYYHHLRNLSKAYLGMTKDMTFDEYFEKIYRVKSVAEYGLWEDHALEWLTQKDRENILFLSYEDLNEDTEREIKKIINFLGLTEDQDVIDKVLKKGKFENMQKDFTVNYSWKFQGFIRQGKVGGWIETLSEEQSLCLDRCVENVKEAGGNIRCTLE